MPKLVIGVFGERRSGKDTAIRALTEVLNQKGVTSEVVATGMGGLLEQDLRAFDLPVNRANLLKRYHVLRNLYGEGTLARGMELAVKNSKANVVIYNCMRMLADLGVVKQYPHNLILYITADFEVRLIRAQNSEKKEGRQVTRESFIAGEADPTELNIKEFNVWTDWKYDSSESLLYLCEASMQGFYDHKIRPILKK